MVHTGGFEVGLRCLLVWLALAAASAAAEQEIRFNRLTIAEGLSQSSVMAITQCHDGYMWFGTQYGLDRFDGHQVRSFQSDPDDPFSLSHSRINALKTAADGLIWVATGRGLDRFDPRTGRAERFALTGPVGFHSDPPLTRIVAEHPDGRLFLSANGAVRIWDPADGLVHRIPFAGDVDESQLALYSEALDPEGRYWVFNAVGLWQLDESAGTMRLAMPLPQSPDFTMYSALAVTPDGLLALALDDAFLLVDPDNLDILEQLTLDDLGGVDIRINAALVSSDGTIWLPTPTRLLSFDPAEGELSVLFSGSRLDPTENSRQQLKLVEHPNGDLWFPSQYGLGWVQPATGQVRVMAHDPSDPFSMPQSIPQLGIRVFIDDEGNVWVGTHLGGVGWHAPSKARFRHIRDRSRPTLSSVPYAGQNVVRSIAETRIGEQVDLWLVLDRAGVRRLRLGDDEQFHWYQSFHARAESGERLPEDAVWSLAVDPLSDRVWVVGTQHLVLLDGRTDRVINRFRLDELGMSGEQGRRVLLSRDGRRLWVATWTGIWEFVPNADRSGVVAVEGGAHRTGWSVSDLLELENGDLLAVGLGGVARFRPGQERPVWLLDHEALGLRVDRSLHAVTPHPDGGWWLGGREIGLGRLRLNPDGLDPEQVSVEWFGTEHGLVDETVYAIQPDRDGGLWLSSNSGLMRWNPETWELRHFTPPDGVQAFEFNHGAAFASDRGYLYFGGVNGVNQFRPEQFANLQPPPRLRLQDVRVNGELLDLGRAAEGILRLRHDQNDLEIQFIGLAFSDPLRVRYAYRLDGVDSDWVEAGAQRQVRYASLQPGTYRFHLRAANSDGVWSDSEQLLAAVVARPPWATAWALSLYGLLLVALAGLTYGEQLRRRRALEAEVAARTAALSEQRVLIERQAKELEQSLEARTVLLANVSHEFRTPLTLVKTSLDRLEGQTSDGEAIALGRRYLRRLLKLVDQLMDFSRLSHEQGRREARPWPLGRMVRMTVNAFSGVAEERGIELISEIEFGWRTRCLQEQVEKILLNLLTNALKFTPPGGQVRVWLKAEAGGVCLSVADSGPGIPDAEQDTIFERFYRVAAVENAEIAGAGIGLALVREAVRANGGRVSVRSQPGQGSQFRVWLPAWREPHAAGPVTLVTERDYARDIEALKPVALHSRGSQVSPSAGRPTILVVEDNVDMRNHLREVLGRQWRVIEAGDGEMGLALARSRAPDMIVSDIMMPGLDGLELLEALRTDVATSHIPILMLSARQDNDTRVQAFALQADGFLPKPFDDDMLLARLGAMMETRRRLHERLRREVAGQSPTGSEAAAPEQEISERDRALLERLRTWVEVHYADPDVKVADMAKAALVDVRTLQRKLKSLLGLAPASLLQETRLEKARAMLLEDRRPIKDIAVRCGFATAQSFTKVFSQAEGLPPSQWRKRAQAHSGHH